MLSMRTWLHVEPGNRVPATVDTFHSKTHWTHSCWSPCPPRLCHTSPRHRTLPRSKQVVCWSHISLWHHRFCKHRKVDGLAQRLQLGQLLNAGRFHLQSFCHLPNTMTPGQSGIASCGHSCSACCEIRMVQATQPFLVLQLSKNKKRLLQVSSQLFKTFVEASDNKRLNLQARRLTQTKCPSLPGSGPVISAS